MDTDTATRNNNDKNVQICEETRTDEKYVKPAATIIESDDDLTLFVDLPGTSKDCLDITIEKGVLTISAPTGCCMPGRPVYTEFEFAHYYRQFAIPENLDPDKAKADFNNGMLTLKVPLAEAAKPRKIDIKAL